MNILTLILNIFTEEEFKKLKNGNKECVEKLYHTYKNRIFNYLLYKLHNNVDTAYDILSDTFVSVLVSVSKLRNQENLGGWLIGIARNLVHGYFRKQKYRSKMIEFVKDKKTYTSPDIIGEISKNYKYALLQTALDQLKPLYKKIFIMKYVEGKKIKEMAASLEQTPDSVASLLKRTKKKLRHIINGLDKGHFTQEVFP